MGGVIAASDAQIFMMPPLMLVFLISAISGFILFGIMMPALKEVRDVHKFGIEEAKEELLAFTHLK